MLLLGVHLSKSLAIFMHVVFVWVPGTLCAVCIRLLLEVECEIFHLCCLMNKVSNYDKLLLIYFCYVTVRFVATYKNCY